MTNPLDLDALAELEAVAKAATQGKWVAKDFVNVGGAKPVHSMKLSVQRGSVLGSLKPEDAAHIEAFQPTAALALIKALRESLDREAKMREALERVQKHTGAHDGATPFVKPITIGDVATTIALIKHEARLALSTDAQEGGEG